MNGIKKSCENSWNQEKPYNFQLQLFTVQQKRFSFHSLFLCAKMLLCPKVITKFRCNTSLASRRVTHKENLEFINTIKDIIRITSAENQCEREI